MNENQNTHIMQELSSEKTELRREVGLFGGISVLAGIMIGSGIFYIGGIVLQRSGMSLGLALLVWLVGGLITLIIALIGLIGYINDETNRRGKEIAVRKINGATERDILRLISSDVVWMALPAILIGAGASWFAGEKWLQQFSEKIPMNAGLFVAGSVAVLLVILATVIYRTWLVANANPVMSLKSE